jgi:hypothetical protein
MLMWLRGQDLPVRAFQQVTGLPDRQGRMPLTLQVMGLVVWRMECILY